MADWPPKKNAAFIVTFPIYDADGDVVSGAATLDSEVSIDGGPFVDCTNEATEIATSSGIYTLSLTAAEMNGDIIATITKTSTAGAKTAVNVMYTAARQLSDLAFPTTSGNSIDVAAGTVSSDVVAWRSLLPNVLLGGFVQADVERWRGSAPGLISTGGEIKADVSRWLDVAVNALISGRVDGSVGTMSATAVDEIWDEMMVEQAQGIPPAAPAFRTILAYIYMALRNRIRITNAEKGFANDASVVIWKKALSDDGQVYQEEEGISGP